MDEDLTPEEVARLDALIREAGRGTTPGAAPDDATLAAYVQGRATDAQVRDVREALLASAGLREDVAYVAGLLDPEVQKRFDEAPVPPTPVIEPETAADARERPPHPGDTLQNRRVGGWLPVLWGLPAAAVVLLLFLLGRQARPTVGWSERPQLTVDQLAHDTLRGDSVAVITRTAEERAIWTLTSAVEPAATGPLARATRQFDVTRPRVPLSLGRAEAGGLTVPAPPADATELELWFLALPSLRLYRAGLPGDRTQMAWPAHEESDGVLTMTFRSGDHFEATAPVECRRR